MFDLQRDIESALVLDEGPDLDDDDHRFFGGPLHSNHTILPRHPIPLRPFVHTPLDYTRPSIRLVSICSEFSPEVGSDARFALQQHMTDTSVSRIGGANQIYRIP
jgi:hypothetical protein